MTTLVKSVPALAKLREPFAPNQISKLPKETRAQIDARKTDKTVMVWKCDVCGGAHHKNAAHLDYVGHAALTDRLLDTDLQWYWEPLAFGPDGLPAMDRNGGLWIRLTVDGVTRLGYGSADGKSGGDAVKEIIGDALRNAAMRFGAALDLWHKGDLHADEPIADTEKPAGPEYADEGYTGAKGGKMKLKARADAFYRDLCGCGDQDMLDALLTSGEACDLEVDLKQYWPGYLTGQGMTPDYEPINTLVRRLKKELPEASDVTRDVNPLGAG